MANLYTTLASIYLLDTLENDNNRQKRTLTEIESLLNSLSPPDIKPHSSTRTAQGYIFNYENDKDINCFFHNDITNKLTENNLSADLGKKTQSLRVIFVPGISDDSYDKDNSDIIENIENLNNIKIIKLDKFNISASDTNYLKISLDSIEACTDIITRGKLFLFNEQLTAKAMHSRKPQQPHPPIINSARNINRHHLTEGNALPYTSNWAGQRTTAYVGNQHARHAPPHPPQGNPRMHPPWLNQPQNIPRPTAMFPLDTDSTIKYYTEATTRMCQALSNGMENPLTFIHQCNHINMFNGLPIIHIPQWVINSSRHVFMHKMSMNHPPHHHHLHMPQHLTPHNNAPPTQSENTPDRSSSPQNAQGSTSNTSIPSNSRPCTPTPPTQSNSEPHLSLHDHE